MTQTIEIPTDRIVRPVARADLPALGGLIIRLASHHDDDATIQSGKLEHDLFALNPWVFCLVAEMENKLIGYALLCRRYQTTQTQRGMELNDLFVAEAHRGQGVGKQLVSAARQLSVEKSCSFFSVAATKQNTSAQEFYRNLGFVDISGGSARFRLAL